MPLTDPDLWRKIDAYVLPLDSAGRTFDEQLRAEHRITARTAEAVIREYRRFLYLCAVSDRRVVPSVAVDAVWHLHLGHTRDYWEVFCPHIGHALHHVPGTPRGHSRDFAATLALYHAEFDAGPPTQFWGDNRDRWWVWRLLAGIVLMALGGFGLNPPTSGALALLLFGVLVTATAKNGLLGWLRGDRHRPIRDRRLPDRAPGRRSAACGGGCGSTGADCGGGGCGGD